ncbi:MAG: DUF418 domain-containing protein, partial [Bacteroidales bacterium]
NVVSFSLPDPAYWDPSGYGGDTGWNLRYFIFNSLLVDGAMRAIFSMLFGAGVILFTTGAGKQDNLADVANAWYRRTIWLILFGLLHAYLLVFPGEILFYYGVVGLFLYPARNAPPGRLFLFSVILLAVLALIRESDYRHNVNLYEQTVAAEQSLARGEAITPEQQAGMNEWYYRLGTYKPGEAALEQAVSSRDSGYLKALTSTAPYVRFMQTEYFYHTGFMDALSMMLLGMAFFKWGIFQAHKKIRFYLMMVLIGYGAGLPVNWLETHAYLRSGFDLLTYFRINRSYDAGRVLMAVGHIGLAMLLVRWRVIPGLQRALAAVGRMALTNYIMHSFIAAVIFIGLKQYGQWQRYQLLYLVAGIWIFQLIVSPLWLRHFRFGPLEWLWRRLTYGSRSMHRDSGSLSG